MEPFCYNKMNKLQQAVYHGMLQGINALESEIQIPRIDGRELYDIFFQMRLDHPEVFWATGYQYRYYDNSSNLILLPEYLFDKNKIREHQKAMKARVEKLARAAKNLSEWRRKNTSTILSVKMSLTIN